MAISSASDLEQKDKWSPGKSGQVQVGELQASCNESKKSIFVSRSHGILGLLFLQQKLANTAISNIITSIL